MCKYSPIFYGLALNVLYSYNNEHIHELQLVTALLNRLQHLMHALVSSLYRPIQLDLCFQLAPTCNMQSLLWFLYKMHCHSTEYNTE